MAIIAETPPIDAEGFHLIDNLLGTIHPLQLVAVPHGVHNP